MKNELDFMYITRAWYVNVFIFNFLECDSYCDFFSQESSYGIFVEGITVEDHGKQSIACIQKGRNLNQNHSSLGCPLYKLECTYDFVPSSNVTSPSAFVHDCCGGQCRVTHKVTKNRIEQQNVTKTKLTLLHNENHNIYLFNHFHL